jgi:hypothetical protein
LDLFSFLACISNQDRPDTRGKKYDLLKGDFD